MTFGNNNNLFSIFRALIGCKSPSKFPKGAPAKGTSTFQSRGHQLCKFIETKESFKWKKCSSPTGMVWYTKMAVVSLFWDTKGAFDWEIWI